MSKPAPVVVLICFLSYGDLALAELCTIDTVPAATLLLPYFEVSLRPFVDDTDLGNNDPVAAARKVDTLFSVNNALATPTVAHVTLWGDWSLSVFDFDIYLSGYDVQTVSLANLFNNGHLPANPPALDCDSDSPSALFKGRRRARIKKARRGHTGRGVGSCIGQAHPGGGVTDLIARGYVTIDNVTRCTLQSPNQPGYFGTGLTSEVNQLWGDWFIVQGNSAIGDSLVHIEAAESTNAFLPGDYTFYGRYVNGLATDQREPLATSWGIHYIQPSAVFSGGTDLIVWRDSKCQTTAETFECDPALDPGPDPDPDPDLACCDPTPGSPPWHPLPQTQVVAFGGQTGAAEICTAAPGGISPAPADPACFSNPTGRYTLGEGDLTLSDSFGWLYLNLNFTLDSGGECSTDGLFGAVAQSWVTPVYLDGDGLYSVGFAATQFTSACSTASPIIMRDLGGL